LFEDELRHRGLTFSIDADSGLHAIETIKGRMLVSLDNLERGFASDADVERISDFVDAILDSASRSDDALDVNQLYWILEPNDYIEPPPYRVSISRQVDRVLVILSSDGTLVTWVTAGILQSLRLSEAEAEAVAFSNLARALDEATLEASDIDGMSLGLISSHLPFKTALVLAPNLKAVLGEALGWPLRAVTPDRDFLFLWDARHSDLVGRVGRVVMKEYDAAPYPVSTEIMEISDDGIRAIGSYRTPAARD